MSPPPSEDPDQPSQSAQQPTSSHPDVVDPGSHADGYSSASSSSSSVHSSEERVPTGGTINKVLQRPRLGSRKSSGTLIVSRDSPHVELRDEDYEPDDARTMSPRRSSEEIDRMGDVAKEALIEQAKALQASLLEIVDRVESVRSEHEKLEGGNKFLQSYIGELMQTSKITSTSAAKRGKK